MEVRRWTKTFALGGRLKSGEGPGVFSLLLNIFFLLLDTSMVAVKKKGERFLLQNQVLMCSSRSHSVE